MNTDQRILGMTDQTVTYLVKDYRNGGIYPTYDQGNRLSADVFDACASQRVCKDPSLWTCPHYRPGI